MRRFLKSIGGTSLCGSATILVANAALHGAGASSSALSNLERRVQALEDSTSVNGLLSFYSGRHHAVFDMNTVVKRCVDPEYNTHVFCHKELPLFLAHHVRALDNLPVGLNAMTSIMDVRKHIAASFYRLVHCPLPLCEATRKEYLEAVRSVTEARAELDILRKMAVGVLELKEHLSRHTRARLSQGEQVVQHQEIYRRLLPELRMIQAPLDECNRYFIYFNFLASQLMHLDGQDYSSSSSKVGTIDREIDLVRLVRGAVDESRQICSDVFGDCPYVDFIVPNEADAMTFAHKSSTISYILVELMKNALRATVDTHMARNAAGIVTCEDMPHVKVVVNASSGTSHACVCIEDEGGGIPRSEMDLVMSYTYTTAAKPALQLMEAVSTDKHNHESTSDIDMSPLAGYGFGLPVSRMYARCFGGDLTIESMEGFGSKAFLFIKK